MIRPKFFISFSLSGTVVSPREISSTTGIEPTTALARGERNADLVLPRQNLWVIRSDAGSEDVSDHWAVLERVLVPKQDLIREIAWQGEVLLTIVIANGQSRCPSLIIPVSMSRFASHVGAVIDIDHMQ
jgi:Domain of unknown function (DUF4279)